MLERTFDARNNSLNLLRLVLAAVVIVSHSWPLGGFGHDPRLGDRDLGRWAVAGFFAISGYLITSSRDRVTFPDFLWRRLLRIYPGFLVSLLVVVLVFAPLAVAIGPGDFTLSDAVSHVVRNAGLQMQQWEVGTTLGTVPHRNAWNGALWTLYYEFLCYVIIGVAFAIFPRRMMPDVAMVGLAVATASRWFVPVTSLSQYRSFSGLAELSAFFMAGAVLYFFADRIRMQGWRRPAAAVAAVGFVVLTGLDATLVALPIAFLCLWLGVKLPFRTVGRKRDISYGLYIYGFPVQQTLALLGAARFGVVGFIALSLLLTLPFALGSWLLVEQPAMRLKGRWKRLRQSITPAAPPPQVPLPVRQTVDQVGRQDN
jgi:peptidoglycan/LPS O-acetylase OafA/YrhL